MDIGIVTLDGRVSPNPSVWFDMMQVIWHGFHRHQLNHQDTHGVGPTSYEDSFLKFVLFFSNSDAAFKMAMFTIFELENMLCSM